LNGTVLQLGRRATLAQYYGKVKAHQDGDHPFQHPDNWDYVLRKEMVHTEEVVPGGVALLVIDLPKLTEVERPQDAQQLRCSSEVAR
jgi:hypothetical protein